MTSIEEAAHAAWEQGELVQAFRLYRSDAARGGSSCKLNLGYFYDEGIGTRQNKRLARHWYLRAYRAGDSAAATNIAILYRERGRDRMMFKWFRKSSRMGDGDADVDVAKLYLAGCGTGKSIPMAKLHLHNAIASNHITEAGREEAEELLRRCSGAL
ncbi:tetratricopeptide repeat protein [Ramlibacter sp. WS9]|uniref:tetratricopeptide repeat protein n=1 Tax=Ramlibacter sp. WS9 TaxID=1882741 RepID=UPI0013053FBA|nr:SEL1-like repeat protein [Ramlibacter sp. WS9]